MKLTILPADTYTVVNKTILSDTDRKILTSLYQPIIGQLPISLYFTLWSDLDKLEIMSIEFTHHHLMANMKLNLTDIVDARKKLEAIGLIKTYVKEDNVNSYIYEMYSPISVSEFFNHPILNVVLYNNVGKSEYEKLVNTFKLPKINLKNYKDITSSFNDVFTSVAYTSFESINDEIVRKNKNNLNIENQVDFDLLISSLPKNVVNERTFNKEIKDLIIKLSFVYDLGILELEKIIRSSVNERGIINKVELRKNCRNYYQFENNDKLPSLIYRTQPEYLRSELNEVSSKEKMIYTFETVSPYDFLKSKQNGAEPTSRDLKLLEILTVDYGLKPGVVNVLVDYVLKTNESKLQKAYTETIAGQWKRLNIETVRDAMALAQKEHKKYKKVKDAKKTNKVEVSTPDWFDKKIEKKEISREEQEEMDNLLKEFR